MNNLTTGQLAQHATTIVCSHYAGTNAAHDIEESLDSHTARQLQFFTAQLSTRVRAYLIHKLVPAATMQLPRWQRWHRIREIIGTHLDNEDNVRALEPIISTLAREIAEDQSLDQ